MVSRFSLIFWRWVVVLHDRLHDARDKVIRENWVDISPLGSPPGSELTDTVTIGGANTTVVYDD